MNKTLKRLLFFLTIIIVLFVIFAFRSTIFSGKLLLHSPPPYQINELGEPPTSCLSDPCEIRFPVGFKNIIAQKNGFKSILIKPEISIFSTTEISLNFHPAPQLTRVEDYQITKPFATNWLNNTLISPAGKTIALFPKAISNPTIISNSSFTLLISTAQSYLIDHLTKQRTLITQQIPNFQTATLSPQANYLSIFSNNSLKLIPLSHTFDTIPLPSPASDTSFIWLNNGKLLFATNNGFDTLDPTENALNPIKFDNTISPSYLFATYNPQSQNYELIADFPEISLPPANLSLSDLEKTIYFQSGNQSYKISI